MAEVNMAKVWDQILAESTARLASTTTSPSSPPRRMGLRLSPQQTPRHLPDVRREAAKVPTDLRAAIRLLVQGEGDWPLFVVGPPGTGKTCAALCLLDYAGGEYHTTPGLCETLIRSAAGRLEWHTGGRGGMLWPETFWARLKAAPLVVLDELGARDRVSDHHYEAVKRVLDERHNKPLVFLSNLDLATLERVYDDRLASRIAAGTVVKVGGPDQRIRA